jgi:collagenase-like PrtC family protease
MPKRSGAMKRPELLAPAGDFEKMRMAIHYGPMRFILETRDSVCATRRKISKLKSLPRR